MAKDVAEVLGYAKPENAIGRHWKNKVTTPKQGGGFITIIPRPDVYRQITKSKLPAEEEIELMDEEVQEKGAHIKCTLEHKSEYSHFK